MVKNVRIVPGQEFTVLADLCASEDAPCGVALYRKNYLSLEPLPGEDEIFFSVCDHITHAHHIAPEVFILRELEAALETSYQQSFEFHKSKGILVGVADRYFRCYEVDLARLPEPRLRQLLLKIKKELPEGESILNFSV
jgi:hypothetical protein